MSYIAAQALSLTIALSGVLSVGEVLTYILTRHWFWLGAGLM